MKWQGKVPPTRAGDTLPATPRRRTLAEVEGDLRFQKRRRRRSARYARGAMKDSLVRFGVAMEAPLLEAFDAIVAQRGGTRSELLRDLVRAEVTKARVETDA